MDETTSPDVAGETKQPAPQPPSEKNALISSPAGSLADTEKPEDRGEKSILKMAEFKVYVDLYKFFLRLTLSVNVFYLAVLGGLLTFLFRPVEGQPNMRLIDKLIAPVKLVLLVTPFVLSCVLTLSFAMGAWYWWFSTIAINKELKPKKESETKNEVKLITRPFFHLLTWLLVAVTIIFMFVTFFLGWIMKDENVLFCDGCLLPPSRLLWVAGAASTVMILLLLVIKRNYLLGKIHYGWKENRKQQVMADSKRIYLIALLFACSFIVSTTILLVDVGIVFDRTSDTSTWIPLVTTIVSAIGTISTIILAWRNDRRVARENKLKIAQLERELEAVRKNPDPPDMDRPNDDSEGGEPVRKDEKDGD